MHGDSQKQEESNAKNVKKDSEKAKKICNSTDNDKKCIFCDEKCEQLYVMLCYNITIAVLKNEDGLVKIHKRIFGIKKYS